MDSRQKSLLQRVRHALRDVQELETTVQTGNQQELAKHINQLVESLRRLAENQDWFDSGGYPLELPVEVVRALDAGINPDTSTADLFKQGLQANQAAKGKVEALSNFRDNLFSEAQKAFPEAAASYQLLKATPAGEPIQPGTAPETQPSAP